MKTREELEIEAKKDIVGSKVNSKAKKEKAILEILSNELILTYADSEELIEKFIDLLTPEYQKINKSIKRNEILNIFKLSAYDKVSSEIIIDVFKNYYSVLEKVGH